MKHYLHIIIKWVTVILQMTIGCVVIKTGYELACGDLPGGNSFSDDPITPIFIILLGCYFLFSSLFRRFLH